jgi:hypothetical protein
LHGNDTDLTHCPQTVIKYTALRQESPGDKAGSTQKYFPKIRANLSADVPSYPRTGPGDTISANPHLLAVDCKMAFPAVYFKFAGIVSQFGDSKE